MKKQLFCENETRVIIGCAMEVLNTLGHGFLEKPYENALAVEFRKRKIPFLQQPHFDLRYKDITVGHFVPDLVVADSVILELKTIDRIGDHELGQMLNYLKITGHQVGLILNFKYARLEWKRVVHGTADGRG